MIKIELAETFLKRLGSKPIVISAPKPNLLQLSVRGPTLSLIFLEEFKSRQELNGLNLYWYLMRNGLGYPVGDNHLSSLLFALTHFCAENCRSQEVLFSTHKQKWLPLGMDMHVGGWVLNLYLKKFGKPKRIFPFLSGYWDITTSIAT